MSSSSSSGGADGVTKLRQLEQCFDKVVDESLKKISESDMGKIFPNPEAIETALQIQDDLVEQRKHSLQQEFKRVCSELSMEELLGGAPTNRSTEQKVSQPFLNLIDEMRLAEAKRLDDAGKKLEVELLKTKEEIAKLRVQMSNEMAAMEEQKNKMTTQL